MTLEILFVLGLIVLAFVLFISEKFSLDVTALLILSILFAGGFLTVEEAISGFSNPAVITIALLFILSHGLQKTRILEYLIVRINKLVSQSKTLGRRLSFYDSMRQRSHEQHGHCCSIYASNYKTSTSVPYEPIKAFNPA